VNRKHTFPEDPDWQLTEASERATVAVDVANEVNLRWLEAPACRDDGSIDRHGVVNTLTAICTAAALLDERWDELTDDQRLDLVQTVRRRSQELRVLFASQ
jgi:hypothetical protein